MTDYSNALADIQKARTFDDIIKVVSRFSAQSRGPGAVLYSGSIGKSSAQRLAADAAMKSGKQTIDDTERGMFLSDQAVGHVILEKSMKILAARMPLNDARSTAMNFLFGGG